MTRGFSVKACKPRQHEWDEVDPGIYMCLMCGAVKVYDEIENTPDDAEVPK